MSKWKKPLSPADLDQERRALFLALAESDMSSAAEVCDLALKHHAKKGVEQTSTYLALAETAIMRYSRPFGANRVPGLDRSVALPLDYLPTHLHEHVLPLHEGIMKMRHYNMAHSDLRVRSVILVRQDAEGPEKWLGKALNFHLQPGDLSNLRMVSRTLWLRLKTELAETATTAFPGVLPGQQVEIGTSKS